MLDMLTAVPVEVRFGDRTLKVGALKLKEFGLLQQFIRERAPRPTEAVKPLLELIDDPVERRNLQKEAFFEEKEDWPPAVGSLQGNRLILESEDGQKIFVRVMLQKYQPGMTDVECDALFGGLSTEGFGVLVSLAFGEDGMDPREAQRLWRRRMGRATGGSPPIDDGGDGDFAGVASTSGASSGP